MALKKYPIRRRQLLGKPKKAILISTAAINESAPFSQITDRNKKMTRVGHRYDRGDFPNLPIWRFKRKRYLGVIRDYSTDLQHEASHITQLAMHDRKGVRIAFDSPLDKFEERLLRAVDGEKPPEKTKSELRRPTDQYRYNHYFTNILPYELRRTLGSNHAVLSAMRALYRSEEMRQVVKRLSSPRSRFDLAEMEDIEKVIAFFDSYAKKIKQRKKKPLLRRMLSSGFWRNLFSKKVG